MKFQSIIESALAIQAIADRKPESRILMEWDSPVHAAELFTPNGAKSGIFGVIATLADGREKVVGQYKKGEVLTPNATLCERVETALETLGWEFSKETTLYRDGSGFKATYSILSNIAGMENLVHSPILPQIITWNSYDGVNKKGLELAIKVLLCLNGCEGFLPGASFAIKHSKESLERFSSGIAGVIEAGRESLPSVANLGEMTLTDEQACNLFANIAGANSSKGAISNKTALTMLNYYFTPDDNERGLSPSLWRAYMAGTRAMRDLSPVRPSQAQAANAALGRAMSFALSQPKAGSIFLHGHSSPYAALVASPRVALVKESNEVQLIDVELA